MPENIPWHILGELDIVLANVDEELRVLFLQDYFFIRCRGKEVSKMLFFSIYELEGF